MSSAPPPAAFLPPLTPPLDHATRTQRIEAAYRQHAEPLVNLALRHTWRTGLDASWAQDLVHDTFLYLHSGKRDDVLGGEPDGLARYLYTTIAAGCKMARREEQRQARGEDASGAEAVASTPFQSPESDLAVAELLTVLDHILATSTPTQRQAFHLVRILGHTQAQAAELMGVTAKVVEHSLVRPTLRARRALRHWRETPRCEGASPRDAGTVVEGIQ